MTTPVSDSLEQQVAGFIARHGLFAGADRVLLAVSGGADSIALLHILHSLRTHGVISSELFCAHVNHQLRGPAGDEDERFVIARAARLGVPIVTRTVDVRAHARNHRLSIETAARRLRLDALSEMAQACGCTWIATGHQKNDNAETLLQRLRRGTGLRGLAGIWPVRQFGPGPSFARSLLDVTRLEILAYLGQHKLSWREDRTNLDPAYTRNFIRHELLPALQRQSRSLLVNELSELATRARGLYDRVQREAAEASRHLVRTRDDDVVIAAACLSLLPEPVAVELIRQTLVQLGSGERDLTERHYRDILEMASSPSPRTLTLPDRFSASRQADDVILARPAMTAHAPGVAVAPVSLRIPGETCLTGWRIEADILDAKDVPIERLKGDKSPFCEHLDLDRVTLPVVVRPRRTGDRFRPLGFGGDKKLGKFLTSAAVPRTVRKQILVFADREQILWVCPVRIGECAKITPGTRQVLRLKVVPAARPATAC